MAQSTFERRLAYGGWTATEVACLSVYFNAAPESLMTGLNGILTPPEQPSSGAGPGAPGTE